MKLDQEHGPGDVPWRRFWAIVLPTFAAVVVLLALFVRSQS